MAGYWQAYSGPGTGQIRQSGQADSPVGNVMLSDGIRGTKYASGAVGPTLWKWVDSPSAGTGGAGITRGEGKAITEGEALNLGLDWNNLPAGYSRAGAPGEKDYMRDIFQKVTGEGDISSLFSKVMQEENVPALQSEVNKTLTLLDQLDQNITARTAGTLTSEAQRQRIEAAEKAPLLQALAPISRTLDSAMKNVSARLDMYTNAISGGEKLTLEQMQEASALAKLEKEYQLKGEQVKSLGKYGGTYYDPTIGGYVTIPQQTSGGGGGDNRTNISDYLGSDWTQ